MQTDFGKRIRLLLTEKDNMSQAGFAKEIGCSPAMVSNILNGKTPPDIQFLQKCQLFFNLSVQDTLSFYISAFSSYSSISIDSSHLDGEWRGLLGTIIVVMLLFPQNSENIEKQKTLDYFKTQIKRKIEDCRGFISSVIDTAAVDLNITPEKSSKEGNGDHSK